MNNNSNKTQDVTKQKSLNESNSASDTEKTKISLSAIKAAQKYRLIGLKLEKG